jgi:hypothetical protein
VPVDTIDSARRLPSAVAMNADPPESPEHVDTPSPPMLIVLPNVEMTVVSAQRFVPAPPMPAVVPKPTMYTSSPASSTSSSQP